MIEMDLSKDFACLDQLQPVTLRRRGSTQQVPIAQAFRLESQATEVQGTAKADAVWHLVLPNEEPAPQPGDVVIDGESNRWTVLAVEELQALGRCKCHTRDLTLAFGCHQLVDVTRPVWGDNGSGPEIVDWAQVCQSLPVNIQLDEMVLDTTTTPPTQNLYFNIILSESIDLRPDDRLTADDGISFRVQAYEQADRIDVLPVARTLQEATS